MQVLFEGFPHHFKYIQIQLFAKKCSTSFAAFFVHLSQNMKRKEPIHSEVEARLECSNRYADARREYCEKAACCFRFGRVWKKTIFICRSKIFSNMAAAYMKLFYRTQWIHTYLHIKNLGLIRRIDWIRNGCILRYTKGIMVDCRQRCSLRYLHVRSVPFIFSYDL